MREAEVDQRVLALEILLCEVLSGLGGEVEGPADEGLADAFVRFGDAGARHASFFVAEVDCEACAGEEKEEAGLPGEGLWRVLVSGEVVVGGRSMRLRRFCIAP